VKPAPFEYHAPRSVEEALSLLSTYGGDAKPLAGGQSLIPAMNFRLATPAVLVDLNRLSTLSFIGSGDSDGDGDGPLRIGAMARHRDLESSAAVAQQVPLLAMVMPSIAHAAIRTRGTIGGSLAHADPAAELPAVMLALEATLTLTSTAGSRTVPASDFFTGLFSTALQPGELLTAVTIPRARPGAAFAFEEVARRHGDFALAGVAAHVTTDRDGRCSEARVALLSVSDRPILSAQAARLLEGQRPVPALLREAAEAAAANDIDPANDIHASSEYRRHLAAVLTRRVLERAFHSLEPA
jgi:carbon-monoxide dehydrogenase medium subunit